MKRLFGLVGILAALLWALAGATPAAGAGTAFSFDLLGPNTAVAPSGSPLAGDTIRTTGSGVFDTAAGTVLASGSFTHIKADGTVFARGTWEATRFTSFRAFGGPNPGTQGGVLAITVTLFPDGGLPHPGFSMTVTCEVNSPGGFMEGTTVAPFTQKTGGHTLFHLN